MNFISIDSSTKKLYVISQNNNVKSSISLLNSRDYASKLPLIIKNILEYNSMSIKELDFIGISQGPGSLTGLRIGISLVKGLSFSNNINILPFDSLDLYGYNKGNNKYIVRKGRKNYYYWKKNVIFSKIKYNSLQEIYQLIPKTEVILLDDRVNEIDFKDYKKEMCNEIYIDDFFKIIQEYLNKRSFVDHFDLSPLYLQKSIAEINWDKKRRMEDDKKF